MRDKNIIFNGISLVHVTAGSSSIKLAESDHYDLNLESDLYISQCQITRQQYIDVAGKRRHFLSGDGNKPVIDVSYFDALEFCDLLTQEAMKQNQAFVFRLPTEVEWEYICRAGSKSLYPFGNNANDMHLHACFAGNSGYEAPGQGRIDHHQGECSDVGRFLPNAFGIHDMCGNVWEWCEPTGTAAQPLDSSVEREYGVLKGGSWSDDVEKLACQYRRLEDREAYRSNIGFRVIMVRNPSQKPVIAVRDYDPLTSTLPEGSVTNSIGMNLIPLKGYSNQERSNSGGNLKPPGHTPSLFFGQTAVTVQQCQLVFGADKTPRKPDSRPLNPAHFITLEVARSFCLQLSSMPAEVAAKRVYRLPTENEWEYAARAGERATTAEELREFDFDSRAWTRENAGSRLPVVGRKTPNCFGLHDMLGCIAEWCEADFDEDGDKQTRKRHEPIDPFAPNQDGFVVELYKPSTPLKLACGGSWLLDRSQAYFWSRLVLPISHRSIHVGFRVVVEQH